MVSSVLTFQAQKTGEAVSTLAEWPMTNRIENALATVGRYLLKTFWPEGLALDYAWAPVPAATLVLSTAVLVLVTGAAWYWRDRYRYLAVGWLLFLGTLVPVIGLVQVGHASMADRYMYFPSIGLFLAVVFGLHEWCGSVPKRMKILTGAECLALAACILLTERQLTYWRNTETIFRHTIDVTKNNGAAHLSLAVAYKRDGRYTDALAEYQETLRLSPRFPMLHLRIGETYDKLGQPDKALTEFQMDLQKQPQSPELHNAIGSALAEQGNIAAATAEFQKAAQLNPLYAEPHLGLAKIYLASGQQTEAAEELLAAFHAEPNNFRNLIKVARYLASNADPSGRDPNTALLLARRADDMSAHRQPEVYDVMGMAFAAAGDFTNAVLHAQKALDLAADARLKDIGPLETRLQLYQQNKPWFESFRGMNAPAVK
jgi:tetratricopeptide (TPR) repeat protein